MKPIDKSIRCGLFLLAAVLSCHIGISQCIASIKTATTTSTIAITGGDVSFGTQSNALVSDDNYSKASATAFLLSGTTNYLAATNFHFAIPVSSSICGVVAEIEESAIGINILAWVQDNSVKLVKGGSVAGNNMAKPGIWTGTDTYGSYGSGTDTWGNTLTPADINASNFGIAISAKFSGVIGVFPSVQVDYIRITVYYNPALPTKILSFNSSLKNNTTHLEWMTADEEDDESINVQRSNDGGTSWANLSDMQMHTGNIGKKYSYDDQLDQSGSYAYRLQVNHKNGFSIYSDTKNVRYAGRGLISIYPNPSSDFLTISTATNKGTLLIRDLFMKPMKLPVQEKPGELYVDIRSLPKGMYFCRLNEESFRFIKN
jgi:hypothetical protein